MLMSLHWFQNIKPSTLERYKSVQHACLLLISGNIVWIIQDWLGRDENTWRYYWLQHCVRLKPTSILERNITLQICQVHPSVPHLLIGDMLNNIQDLIDHEENKCQGNSIDQCAL